MTKDAVGPSLVVCYRKLESYKVSCNTFSDAACATHNHLDYRLFLPQCQSEYPVFLLKFSFFNRIHINLLAWPYIYLQFGQNITGNSRTSNNNNKQ